jgi:hypothetical protein
MSARAHAEAKPSALVARPALLVQRKCAACAAAEHEAEHDETLVQRRAGGGSSGGPSLVDAALASPGTPLDAGVRGGMEKTFGQDFSRVRVHDDALAHESARSVDALAYTVGSDIVFGAGQFRPQTHDGRHLLAHELAHTVQQGGLQRRAGGAGLATDPLPTLEHEAERAADAALARQPGPTPTLTRIGVPLLARAPTRKWQQTTLPNPPSFVLAESIEPDEVRNRTRAFKVPDLKLPREKGDTVALWQSKADAGALEATISVADYERPSLKQERPSRDTLESIWLTKIGWDRQTLKDNWETSGGDPAKLWQTKGGNEVCEIDHIVELQFAGNNTKENVQLLDKKDNADSGRTLWQTIRGYAKDISDSKGAPNFKEVVLHFDSVSQQGAGLCNACCMVEKQVTKLAQGGVKPAAADATADLEKYPLSAGGSATELFVPKLAKGKPKDPAATDDLLAESKIPQNRSAASLIVGMTLQTLRRTENPHKIFALFDPEKSRLPITVAKNATIELNVVNHKATIAHKTAKLGFTYPYLSPGEITSLHETPEGLAGEGVIHPTIPFLGPLNIRFAPGVLTITKGLDHKQLKPPFPGFRITKGELGLDLAPEFRPSGTIGFAIGPEKSPVAAGEVTASVEGGNFAAKGTLNARVPGLDEATGNVSYVSNVGWNGRIELKTSKIPSTKDVAVVVTLGPNGFAIEGGLTIVLPGEGNTVAVHVAHRGDKFVLAGGATLKIPVRGVDPVELSFEHDGEHLRGHGKTGIAFHGLHGDVTIAYHDGKFSGSGHIDIKKGRAKGDLTVNLSERNKVSGEGSITYEITKDLIATAGIILREDESVTLKGALEIAKPIELFPPAKGQKTLLSIPTINIPIPGASIGPVGLVVKIDGGIEIHYQVGPGQLRNTKIEAAFNPLDEKPDLDLMLGTQLYVGANAGIGGYVRGAIAVDIKIASLSGGLTVGAKADLEGKAQADLALHYTKSRITFDAKGLIEAGLALGLTLDADVTAEAGWGPFSVEWKKVWHLAAYKFDTGLQFGLEAPLHYASDEPFKPPSVDDIKWKLPTLDPQMLLEKAMNSASANETKDE